MYNVFITAVAPLDGGSLFFLSLGLAVCSNVLYLVYLKNYGAKAKHIAKTKQSFGKCPVNPMFYMKKPELPSLEMYRTNGNKQFTIPSDLLDDIASRFLLDAPDSELSDPISLCFLTELAYWFYLDEYVQEDDSLNTLKFDPFALQLLTHVNIEPKNGATIEKMLQEFRDFKHRVPTYGALLLNAELSHVLLVQGFWHRASWGFPKGKINVEEEPHKCAVREVLEETGYDISSQLNENVYLENTIGEQKVRLYIIPGVSMSTEFAPLTKGEIKEFKWFPIHELPSHKNDRSIPKSTGTTNMFYMVMPFVKPLRDWISIKSRSSSALLDKSLGGSESRKRLNYSECSPHNVTKSTGSKAVNNLFKGQQDMWITDHLPFTICQAPNKEQKQSKKGKKGQSDVSGEAPQKKFTFKSREKTKIGQQHLPCEGSSSLGASDSKSFKCYSWQHFKFNKKAINEALDRVWYGVTL